MFCCDDPASNDMSDEELKPVEIPPTILKLELEPSVEVPVDITVVKNDARMWALFAVNTHRAT